MRRFIAVVLFVGGLVFITPLATEGGFNGAKGISLVIAGLLFLLSWRLFRPRGSADAKAAGEQVTPRRHVTAPATAPVQADRYAERRALLKAKRAFEDLKHLVGVPGLAAKQRTTLILADEGLQFTDPKTGGLQYLMRWGTLLGVETSDSQSDRAQGQINSVRTGAIARGTTLSGAVAVEAVGLFLDKSPLILKYRIVPDDPMVSVAVLSTWLNDEIATRVLAYRTELVATGKLTFETRSISE